MIYFLTDVGGFKTIVCSMLIGSTHPTNSTFYDLTSSIEISYDYQINTTGLRWGSSFSVGFREYDNTLNNSVPFGDFTIKFKL